jgi:protein gp37
MHSVCSFHQEGSISASVMQDMKVMDMSVQKLVSIQHTVISEEKQIGSLDRHPICMSLPLTFKTSRQIFTNFCMNTMPFEATLIWCILIYYNQQ